MADWKDKFREGSFRDIPFKTERSTVKGGRRKQDHEYAERDVGNSEDLGRKLKSFELELLVIGDDYFDQRDALEEALNAQGPGTLIHPYRGTLIVQAGSYTLIETVEEGRIARFTVQFTEAGVAKFPEQLADDLNDTLNNADAVKDNAQSFFEEAYSIAAQTNSVIEGAARDVDAAVDFAEDAVNAVTEPITNFAFAISEFKASIGDLIRAPDELAQRFRDTFDLLLAEFENEPETSEKIFGGFKNLDDAFEPIIGSTPSRQREQANQNAISNIVKQLTLSNQAQAAVDVDFDSTSAALQSRNDIVAGLDLQLFDTDDDDLYQSVKDLQTSLVRAIPRTGTTELITIELKKTLPALVVAYDHFEDLDKEQEIIDQNAVEHPGFVPGGDTLQVSAG